MIYSATADEQAAGAFSAINLDAIVGQIESSGFAVVEGLVSAASCELLMASILEDVAKVRRLNKLTPHEKATGKGHLQLGLRRGAPYVRPDVVANPLVEQIVAAVVGTGAWLGFYNGNVNLPGSSYQPLHFDRPFSWRTQEAAIQDNVSWPPPTTTLSCSVALTDISEDNGATEIYPGSHQETAVTQWAPTERLANHPELLERWAPPQKMLIPAGAICFRDPRMWHRGVPNPGSHTRPMMALTYHAERCRSWRGRLVKRLEPGVLERCQADASLKLLDDRTLGDARLVFEESASQVFLAAPSQHGVNRNVRFVGGGLKVNHFVDAHLVGGAKVVQDKIIGPV